MLYLVRLTIAMLALTAVPTAAQEALSVRLTSPLGRSGITGTIRIVAQVASPVAGAIVPVRFYVDGKLLGEDGDGAPYAIEWVDENPYEAREIRVEVTDHLGNVVHDSVELEPLDVVEETAVASVLVEATVTDPKTGRAIPTLRAEDFTLLENGTPQALDLVQLERMSTHFTLLVDASQSMARRVDFVKRTAQRLVAGLRVNDTVLVAPFRRTVVGVTGPTTDAATIADAIMDIRSAGGTAIVDTLATLPELFARAEGRHVIILVTDGYDEHSQRSLDEALDALKKLHAAVYVVGIGGVAGISLKGELLLRQIASETGGRALFPSREEQLPDVHEKIVSEVYSRYLITYTPTNQEPDGSYRAIALTTPDPAHKVAARKGYFAPKPPPIRPTLEFSATLPGAGDSVLSAGDLTILEDGVPQQLEAFHEATSPMSIVLALDGSGSMRRALETVKTAAATFVEALRPADPLALVQFADDVTFAHDFSTVRRLSTEAITSHAAMGGTALWDALYESIALLERRQDTRRAVVVVTDGRDENNPGTGPGSRHTLSEVMAQLRQTDTTVYAIGLGPNVDREGLQAVSELSGGNAYFPEDVTTLAEQYGRVLNDLRRRYVVTYTSTNSARNGEWRDVTISSATPGVVIRSRGGYTAPASANARQASPEQRER